CKSQSVSPQRLTAMRNCELHLAVAEPTYIRQLPDVVAQSLQSQAPDHDRASRGAHRHADSRLTVARGCGWVMEVVGEHQPRADDLDLFVGMHQALLVQIPRM